MRNVSMDCESIVKRVFDGRDFSRGNNLKRQIAFIRNVYTVYEFQEILLSSNYHPDNVYCYSVDNKTTTGIFEKIEKLSGCLPNIILNPIRYDFDSWGHQQNRAQFKCLEMVMDRKWDHALILQNNDMVLKPAEHLSELSELLNYTNGMYFESPKEGWYIKDADWTPAESGVPLDILYKPLQIWKGFNEVIVSRTFIESIFDKLNLERIMNLFDRKELFGVDEMLFQTLYRNYLGLDGQSISNCTNFVPNTIERWTDWIQQGTNGTYHPDCKSKFERHWICIMGVEYLPGFIETNFVIGNKILDSFDVGPAICLKEMFQQDRIKKKITRVELQNFPQFREMEIKYNGTYEKNDFRCGE
ncbi:unnamed protein product [Caenorhabditis angaria]|uniref:Uncharacterized protein n=1 Tax=Caenorhabditis angaria TaxID=860376 RepID=A0A9P1IZA6_9PELO|nr:unnamed protein product [Caenorhabditis angaria]